MTDSPRPELDMETQEFVHQLFDLARQGNSQRLEQLLQQACRRTCVTTRAIAC